MLKLNYLYHNCLIVKYLTNWSPNKIYFTLPYGHQINKQTYLKSSIIKKKSNFI